MKIIIWLSIDGSKNKFWWYFNDLTPKKFGKSSVKFCRTEPNRICQKTAEPRTEPNRTEISVASYSAPAISTSMIVPDRFQVYFLIPLSVHKPSHIDCDDCCRLLTSLYLCCPGSADCFVSTRHWKTAPLSWRLSAPLGHIHNCPFWERVRLEAPLNVSDFQSGPGL